MNERGQPKVATAKPSAWGGMMGTYWLVTWTTYGSWLPGDSRGFRTWRGREYVPPPARYAASGERVYNPADYRERLGNAQEATGSSVALSAADRRMALSALCDEVAQMSIIPRALAVADEHVHLLACFGGTFIRPAVGRLKAAVTRRLHDLELRAGRVWGRCCQMRSLRDESALATAVEYVVGHRAQGAEVYEWTTQADDLSSAD